MTVITKEKKEVMKDTVRALLHNKASQINLMLLMRKIDGLAGDNSAIEQGIKSIFLAIKLLIDIRAAEEVQIKLREIALK